MDFTILHFAIHIVWRANVICTCRKSGIARKTTVAYPELRLLSRCAGKVGKVTVDTEKFVNRSTQMMEKYGNKTLQNKNVQYGTLRASMRANLIKCPRCHGKGSVQGYNGYVYTCARCNGSGLIRVVR